MDIDIFDIAGNYLIVLAIAIVAIGILFFIIAFPAYKLNDPSVDNIDEVEEKREINKSKKSKSKIKESTISNGPQSKISAIKQIAKTSGQPVLKKPVAAVELQPQKDKVKKTKEIEETISKKEDEGRKLIEEWEMATSRRGKKNKSKKEEEDEEGEETAAVSGIDISAHQNKAIQLSDLPISKIETAMTNNEKTSKKKKIKEIVTSLAHSEAIDENSTISRATTTDSNSNIDCGTLTNNIRDSIVEQSVAIGNMIEEVEGVEEEDFSVIDGSSRNKNKKKKKKTPESRSKYQELPVAELPVTNDYHESANAELDSQNLQKFNETLHVAKSHPTNKNQTKSKEKLVQKNFAPETILCSESILPVTPLVDNYINSSHQPLQKVESNLPAVENTGISSMEKLSNGLPSVEEIGDWQAAKVIKKKKVQREI